MEESPQQAPADALLGAVLDQRYRIERKLGQGGMGMVYLGEHLRTGRKCAVKLLPPEAAQDPEAVKRFDREARVLGALGHPGIVGIHDFSETADGRPYFVMDYLEGEDLQTRLGRVGRLGWDETRKIVDEIAAALYAAHQAGVLHRDLKPANVFLARSPGAPERVVILDFGLAKGGISESVALTRSDMVMGTPLYMSPEQARGVVVDARSDIYSLAALTYELLAGRPPFVGSNYTAVLASLLTDPPRILSECAQVQVPKHLDVALDVALSKMPESRQPDVASFASAVLQQRPRWIDTTAQRVAVAAPAPGVVESPTGATGALASSMEMDATVASNPAMSDQSSLQGAATVASAAAQRPAATGPPASVATSPGVAPPPPSVATSPAEPPPPPSVATSPGQTPPPPNMAESDLAVQRVSTPPRPASVDGPSPGPKRTSLLPVVLVLVAIAVVGAIAAYWLGQRRGSARGSTQGTPQAAAPSADGDGAVVASPRVGDARAASPDATIVKQNTGNQGPDKHPPIVDMGLGKQSNVRKNAGRRGAARRTSPRPPMRRRARAMESTRPRHRITKRPTSGRESSRGLRGVRLGDLYIKGRYQECVRQAGRMRRTKSVLEYGFYCANKLRNSGAMKRFCRKYLRLNLSNSHTTTCRGVLKR